MTTSSRAPAVLTRASALCDTQLRGAVQRLTPEIRTPVSYHFGWTDDKGESIVGGGGKGVRSALAVLSAEATGKDAEVGIAAAVAIELVHNFSLLHDDIIDKDTQRRHRPTVWSLWGVGEAIIAGDALLSLAHEVLLEAPSSSCMDAALRLAKATSAMIAGQAQDVAAEGGRITSLKACQDMEAAKTGALLAAAASLGAVLGGADERLIGALDTFGMEIGLAFQAIDDVLGIWGDPAVTGKPAWSDLRQAKVSLPVSAAANAGGNLADELMDLLNKPNRDEAELARTAEIVDQAGGRQYAEVFASQRCEAASGALESVDLPKETKSELLELASFVVGRAF